MSYTRTATSTSADSSVFVVTILNGLPRPHGISHTSFIVYLPNLRIKVTVAFGNFTVLGQLVRLIRLSIRFLFVRPRIRYCFFSPKGHPLKLASPMGFVGNYAPGGLSPQMYDMPVIQKKDGEVAHEPLPIRCGYRKIGVTCCSRRSLYRSYGRGGWHEPSCEVMYEGGT